MLLKQQCSITLTTCTTGQVLQAVSIKILVGFLALEMSTIYVLFKVSFLHAYKIITMKHDEKKT